MRFIRDCLRSITANTLLISPWLFNIRLLCFKTTQRWKAETKPHYPQDENKIHQRHRRNFFPGHDLLHRHIFDRLLCLNPTWDICSCLVLYWTFFSSSGLHFSLIISRFSFWPPSSIIFRFYHPKQTSSEMNSIVRVHTRKLCVLFSACIKSFYFSPLCLCWAQCQTKSAAWKCSCLGRNNSKWTQITAQNWNMVLCQVWTF